MMKKSIFLLILMAFVLITPSGVNAMLPWYAEDWECQLFKGGVALYPETVKLIEENADVYCEDYYRSGDGFHFQNIVGLETNHYLGMANLWYGGLPAWADPTRDAMQIEENFYHGNDPSSLVGWRTTNISGNPVNMLRWDWDFRFVNLNDLYLKNYSERVNRYKILRRAAGETTWVPVATVEGNNWFEDDVSQNISVNYEYLVKSLYGDPAELEYWFTPESEPVQIDPVVSDDIKFWLIRKGFQEERYKAYFDPDSPGPTLGYDQVFSWTIQFGVSGSLVGANFELEVHNGKYSNGSDKIEFVSPSEITPDSVTFTIDRSVKDLLTNSGGIVYRLHCVSTSGQNTYFPATSPGTTTRWIWATVNNRVMLNTWASWAMRVDGAGQEWRQTVINVVGRLCGDGVNPGEGLVKYDGVFFDVVNERLMFNNVKPYEYLGDAVYLAAIEDFILGVRDAMDQQGLTNNKIIINSKGLILADWLKGRPGTVSGFMWENWALQSSWYKELLPACWLIHNGDPLWEVWIRHTIDLNYHVQYYNSEHYLIDDYATDIRKQALVACLMSKNDKTLYGFGRWKQNLTDMNQAPDILEQVNILPEQMINLGNPINDPFIGVNWPTAAEVDIAVADSTEGINLLYDTAPNLFTVDGTFARRQFALRARA